MGTSFPLTTMEEFLYWEDRPAYPWSCFVRLRFSGCLDRNALEAAVRTVLPRHPMLTAMLRTAGRRRLEWFVVEDPRPIIVWEVGTTGGPLPPASRLDLRQEIGIRFHVRTDATASDLTIQFHHACCDGAGIFQFIKEWLVAYAALLDAAPNGPRFAELDPQRLRGRGRFGLTPAKLLRMAPKQAVGLLGARQFLMRKPIPVIPHRAASDDSPLPTNYPATLNRRLDTADTTSLRKTSVRRGVTTNDLLAKDLFLALADWRLRQNVESDGQWLRMMIPMNLRTTADRHMPAANLVSSVFLDRRPDDFADEDRLLRGIHDEMDLIKRLELGLTFIFSTAVCRRLGGLERQVRADKCTISCIFTNLGTPLAHVPLPQKDWCIAAGNVTLVDADIVAPLRPYSCITVAVGLYAHRLGITLHYDPRPMSERQAGDLLDTFVARIQASVAAA